MEYLLKLVHELEEKEPSNYNPVALVELAEILSAFPNPVPGWSFKYLGRSKGVNRFSASSWTEEHETSRILGFPLLDCLTWAIKLGFKRDIEENVLKLRRLNKHRSNSLFLS